MTHTQILLIIDMFLIIGAYLFGYHRGRTEIVRRRRAEEREEERLRTLLAKRRAREARGEQ